MAAAQHFSLLSKSENFAPFSGRRKCTKKWTLMASFEMIFFYLHLLALLAKFPLFLKAKAKKKDHSLSNVSGRERKRLGKEEEEESEQLSTVNPTLCNTQWSGVGWRWLGERRRERDATFWALQEKRKGDVENGKTGEREDGHRSIHKCELSSGYRY